MNTSVKLVCFLDSLCLLTWDLGYFSAVSRRPCARRLARSKSKSYHRIFISGGAFWPWGKFLASRSSHPGSIPRFLRSIPGRCTWHRRGRLEHSVVRVPPWVPFSTLSTADTVLSPQPTNRICIPQAQNQNSLARWVDISKTLSRYTTSQVFLHFRRALGPCKWSLAND